MESLAPKELILYGMFLVNVIPFNLNATQLKRITLKKKKKEKET